jgi:hypothetical protein
MESQGLRIKISLLWIFVDFVLLLLLVVNDLDPNGGMRQAIAGFPSQMVPVVLLGGSVILLIPFAMALLSLTLKDSASRRMNLILGAFFTFFLFSGVVYGLSRLTISTAYLVLLMTVTFVAAALVVRYAYRWRLQGAKMMRPRTESAGAFTPIVPVFLGGLQRHTQF